MVEPANKKYRPSNGTEGMGFMAKWCDLCAKDAAFRAGTGDSCPIAANAVCFARNDSEYPAEWTYDETGQPCCTAFEAEVEKPDPNEPLQTALPLDDA